MSFPTEISSEFSNTIFRWVFQHNFPASFQQRNHTTTHATIRFPVSFEDNLNIAITFQYFSGEFPGNSPENNAEKLGPTHGLYWKHFVNFYCSRNGDEEVFLTRFWTGFVTLFSGEFPGNSPENNLNTHVFFWGALFDKWILMFFFSGHAGCLFQIDFLVSFRETHQKKVVTKRVQNLVRKTLWEAVINRLQGLYKK